MAKRQFTVTLDRSGQRVVKEYSKGPVPSRTKRSSNAHHSLKYVNNNNNNSKRVKSDVSTSGYGHNRVDDSRIGPNDLRVKLTQKRISRDEQLEIAERKKKELYEKVSRAIRSAESQDESHLRNTNSSRRVDAPPAPETDTIRTYVPETTFNGARTRSPDRVMRYSGGVSDPRSGVEELPQVRVPSSTLRAVQASSSQLDTQLCPATGGMSRPPYPVNPPQPQPQPQPLTVASLLHSLGLGKYVINFQAEEIDMLALRQMGEHDLKDLGIPMGPRKKIVLAVKQHTRRLATQARSNYMQ